MTGFGRSTITSASGKITLEITSTNRRFLEINILMPKTFIFLENDIRKLIEKKIFRGHVVLKFDFLFDEKNIMTMLPNVTYLKNLKKGWEKIATDLGYKKDQISLEFLIKESKYLPDEKIKDEEIFKKIFLDATQKALDKILDMKNKEGNALHLDIESRIEFIKKLISIIQKKAPDAKKAYEKKLKEKLKALISEESFKDKILKEAAIYSEKVDITEEITRLNSHIKQFLNIIENSKEAIGRQLEFLLQEALRESNTIASKAQDINIISKVVEIKTEIEKIKEQIQNIE